MAAAGKLDRRSTRTRTRPPQAPKQPIELGLGIYAGMAAE